MREIKEVERKLFVLKNYELVFNGRDVRQKFPVCCGVELDLGHFLKTMVRGANVEIKGKSYTMFEVTCPSCGRIIPPEWHETEHNGKLKRHE